MKKIVLATRNNHKLSEFQKMLPNVQILSLDDVGFEGDIEENGTTFEENAYIKAKTVYDFCKAKNLDVAVLSDDSGTCVDALNGAPGIHSARFGGNHDDESNRQRMLKELEGETNRKAHFECVLCYIENSKPNYFVGQTFGQITTKKLGDDSFGYDCIFLSDDLGKTFGEASAEEKNSVSHRSRAVAKLKEFLGDENV